MKLWTVVLILSLIPCACTMAQGFMDPRQKALLDQYYAQALTNTIPGSWITDGTVSFEKLTNNVQQMLVDGSNAWIWVTENADLIATNFTYDESITNGVQFNNNGDLNVTFKTNYAPAVKDVLRQTNGTYSLSTTNVLIFCDTDNGDITNNLPAGTDGKYYRFANCGSFTNEVYIVPNGTELIFGVNTNHILLDSEVLDLYYESTEGWW